MIFKRLLGIAILASFLITNNMQAQKEYFSISGTITDKKGNGIEQVEIFIPELNKGTVSDEAGNFKLKKIPAGQQLVVFTSLGYSEKSRKFQLNEDVEDFAISLEETQFKFDAVVVTGTPSVSDPLRSTAEVNVLSGREMFQRQKASLGRSIDQIPGLRSINTGNNVGKPVIRGLSGNRIRILHNNIPLDYQQYGVRHMPPIDPYLSRRIEVVQGPSSVLYGSDALGGAINYIPLHPHFDDTEYVKAEVLSDYNSNNDQYTGGLKFEASNGSWGISGGLTYKNAGNITTPDAQTFDPDNPDATADLPKFSGELDNTDFEQTNATVTIENSGDYGNVSLNYTRWANEHNFLLPNGKGLGQFISNDILQLKGIFVLSDQLKLKPNLTFSSNLRQSNKKGNTRDQLPDPSDRAHLDILRDAYNAEVELVHDLGKLSGTLGITGGFTDQETRGLGEPLVPSAEITTFSIFAFEEYEFDQLTLTGGLRFDYRSQEAEPNTVLNLPDTADDETSSVLEQDYTTVTGSLGANYAFTDEFSVAANIGRGFRAPSIFNLHVDGNHGGIAAFQKGDPNLDPEFSFNTDLSFKYRSPKFKANASIYRNAIDDYIFLVNTGESIPDGPPILQTIQGDAVISGGHLSANYQLLPFLSLNANAEIVKGESDDDFEDVDELPLMPANRFGGGFQLNFEDFSFIKNPVFAADVDHVFSRDAAGRYEPFWQFGPAFPFGRASTDAYTLFNASFDFDVNVQDQLMNISIYGENLTDETYRDFLDTYKGYALNPGINVGLRVNIPITIAQQQ
jgi:iron complex outermembrane receptor protein/hemoglobin/transferrin/lactoferrin receptor protein